MALGREINDAEETEINRNQRETMLKKSDALQSRDAVSDRQCYGQNGPVFISILHTTGPSLA
jgi:hypothetical protein